MIFFVFLLKKYQIYISLYIPIIFSNYSTVNSDSYNISPIASLYILLYFLAFPSISPCLASVDSTIGSSTLPPYEDSANFLFSNLYSFSIRSSSYFTRSYNRGTLQICLILSY